MRKWWLIKVLGLGGGITAFFVGYFWLLRHPLFPVTFMPRLALDRWISFQPAALSLYLSFWFYISLVPALLKERRELVGYALAATGLGVIGLGIFLFWPTAVPLADVEWALYPSFAFLKSVDLTGNACPSMHVAFSVFTAIWFNRLFRQMEGGPYLVGLNWLWCLGILYSTVAIRQHVALDVVAGCVLGLVLAVVPLRWIDGRVRPHGGHRPNRLG